MLFLGYKWSIRITIQFDNQRKNPYPFYLCNQTEQNTIHWINNINAVVVLEVFILCHKRKDPFRTVTACPTRSILFPSRILILTSPPRREHWRAEKQHFRSDILKTSGKKWRNELIKNSGPWIKMTWTELVNTVTYQTKYVSWELSPNNEQAQCVQILLNVNI